MMRFESLREGFSVSLGSRPVFVHSAKSPCLYIAVRPPLRRVEGRQGEGSWQKRRLQSWKPLRSFRLLETGSERVTVNFEGRIGVELVDEGEFLRLCLRSSEEAPALLLRLAGFGEERVYGGGSGAGPSLDVSRRFVEFWPEGEGASPRGRDWPVASFITSDHRWLRAEGEGWHAADLRSPDHVSLQFSSPPRSIELGAATTAAGALGALGRRGRASPLPPAWTREGAILSFAGPLSELAARLDRFERRAFRPAALRLVDARPFEADGREDARIDFLRDRGIRVLALARPCLGPGSPALREARAAGFLIDEEGGSLDLESPGARDWARERLSVLIEGLDLSGLRLELGPEPRGAPGAEGDAEAGKAASRRPLLWSLLAAEAVERVRGRPDFLLSSTRGWGASGARHDALIPAAVDEVAELPSRVEALLAHGFSGAGFAWLDPSLPWSVACEGGRASPAAAAARSQARRRALELAAFGPVLEAGPGSWGGSEEEDRHLARMAGIHAELAPWHRSIAEYYASSFIPPLRHVSLHHEAAGGLHLRRNQFLYGSDLFVAVSGEAGDLVTLELPEGDWIHLWSSRHFRGGLVGIEAPTGKPAVFYRAASAFAPLFDGIRRDARRS